MVQNNKVLTVSYGTFSCTLEGFEDSFDTMKAIAEYFRDLAADDRYFGAEPPQPDADMLARIAEREIARQVEARADSEGIHLRAAQDAPAAIPAAAAAAAAAPTVAEPAPAAPEAQVQEAQAPEAQIQPTPEPEPELVVEPAIEEVSADAAVVEAAQAVDQAEDPVLDTVAEVQTDPVIELPAPAMEAPEVEVAAEEEEVEAQVEAEAPAVEQEADEPAEDLDEATIAAVIAADDAPKAESIEAETVEPTSDNIIPAADSIAAKLQRIRDVVARKAQPVEDEVEFTEDQHAEAFTAEAARDIAAALDEEDDDNILASVQTETEDDAELDQVADQAAEMSIEDAFEAAEEDLEEDVTEALDKLDLTSDLEVAEAEEPADEDIEIVDDSNPQKVRVHKVKRSQIAEALASGELEEVAEADDASDSELSAEDEADLLRELAQVEAEMADDLDVADTESDMGENLFAEDASFDEGENPEQEVAAEPAPRSARKADMPNSDVSRLMDAADEKLGDPESATNRETFNQLRAAVAAAEAERQAGGTVGLGNDDEPYREDLASVVRPRRPVATPARADRPNRAKPAAPLKLVAEQRIDAPTANKGPIRPRRIRNAHLDDMDAGVETREGGFAAFAAEQGAVELPELLEAAAAYLSFIEGREQFSRPQLMNKVRQLDSQTGFNREDGLRSFGQLLREGKIEKAGSGRFTVSGEIGYHPNSRAAG